MRASRSHPGRPAFTLVEVLVVAFILMLLAMIALPAVRNVLRDAKKAQNAREIVAFLNEARARAIASGQDVGVLISRFGAADSYVRSFSNELALTNAVPPYSGDATSARAFLMHDPNGESVPVPPDVPAPNNGPTNAGFFSADDSPLLYLSAGLITAGEEISAPIRLGDRLELPGGRAVTILQMVQVPAANPFGMAGTKVIFDPVDRLTDEITLATPGFRTETFPDAIRRFPAAMPITDIRRAVRFRIHRKPMLSSVGALSMLRGMAIDLNYSGIGPDGIQFSQAVIAPGVAADTAVNCHPVVIVFGADGAVKVVERGVNTGSGPPAYATTIKPTGNIFLCVGKTDGIRPDDPLSTQNRATANVMDPESSWVSINVATGLVTASPAAQVRPDQFTAADVVAQTRQAARASRAFAIEADSLSTF